MYTSFVLVALTSSLVATSPSDGLTWHDYTHARKMAQSDKKPVAVFVGKGASGFEKVCKDGKLSADVQKTLADSYLCVYLDVGTEAGKKLASQFGIDGGMGLVLSDRTGEKQAFSHDGDLSTTDMTTWVKHFADPSVTVSTTMANTSSRISSYPPSNGMTTVGGSGYIIYGMSGYTTGGVSYGGGCPGGVCYRR